MGFHDTLEPGSEIDSYRIEAPVARSGMASIYRAVDLRDNRVVALKIPHPDLGGLPLWALGVRVEFVSGAEDLSGLLQDLVNRISAPNLSKFQ